MTITVRVDIKTANRPWVEVGITTIDDTEYIHGRDIFPLNGVVQFNIGAVGLLPAEIRLTRIH